jgi:hypothetical protein
VIKVDFATARAVLDKIGVPRQDSIGRDILVMMKKEEKFESFFSPFRSAVVHDGWFRERCQTDEFLEYWIFGASCIVQFGYGIDGVRAVYVYPHCNPHCTEARLRLFLKPMVEHWWKELTSAAAFNAEQRARGPLTLS